LSVASGEGSTLHRAFSATKHPKAATRFLDNSRQFGVVAGEPNPLQPTLAHMIRVGSADTLERGALLVDRDGVTRTARAKRSNRQDQPRIAIPFTPPSITSSMSSAFSHPAARSAPNEQMHSGCGERLPAPKTEISSSNLAANTKFPRQNQL
jgi:hypothetical protein